MNDPTKILVVDDEEVIRDACDRILRRAGYEVALAVDGGQAAQCIRCNKFDLVLLDIKMPVLDGMQVMDIIAQKRPDLKVIVITGHGTAQTALEAVKAGASDFLTKPFSPNELRQAVNKVLDDPRSEAATGAAA